MKTKSITTQAEAEAAIAAEAVVDAIGIVEVTTRDRSIRSVRVGNLIISSDYGLSLAEVIIFEEAERFKVEFKSELFGDGESYFDYGHEATAYARKLRDEAPGLAESIKVQKVKVLIDDDGMVASEVEVLGDFGDEAFPF